MNGESVRRAPASGAVSMANTLLVVSIFLPWIDVQGEPSVLGTDMLIGQHPNAANGYVFAPWLTAVVLVVSACCGTPRRPQDAIKFLAIVLFGIAAAACGGMWVLDGVVDRTGDVGGGAGLATFAFVVLGVAWVREPSRRHGPRGSDSSGAVV